MLPEHVEQLKHLWDNQNKIQKPILDEQELEEINQLCMEAYHNQTTVELSVYTNGNIDLHMGIISKIDLQTHTIQFKTAETVKHIPFASVIRIRNVH